MGPTHSSAHTSLLVSPPQASNFSPSLIEKQQPICLSAKLLTERNKVMTKLLQFNHHHHTLRFVEGFYRTRYFVYIFSHPSLRDYKLFATLKLDDGIRLTEICSFLKQSLSLSASLVLGFSFLVKRNRLS